MTDPSTTSEERVSTPNTRRLERRITSCLAGFLMVGTFSGPLFGLHDAVSSRIIRDFTHLLLDSVSAVLTERAVEMGADLASARNGEMDDIHWLEAMASPNSRAI